ncbi:MAG: pilus assembly PilX N-terminal domain-containing protein [Burkholderiales bacterium]
MTKPRSSIPAARRRACALPRAERGVVVFIALIVLVAMMLAGIATLRSSGSAILTAGNLALRHSATVAGDLGIETGLTWLRAQGPVTLEARSPGQGYYASWNDLEPPLPTGQRFDPLVWSEANWEDAAKAVQVNNGAVDAAGNRVSYVIHRMCAVAGPSSGTGAPANQECVTLTDPGKGGPKEAGATPFTGSSQVYYRITARIEGPKNTVSYIQTMVY